MPRKTTKKPTTRKAAPKKAAVKKAAPKRKKYQTGGTAKPQMPRSQALAMQEARDREAARMAQEAEMQRQIEMMRQDLPPEPAPEPTPEQYNAAMQRYRRERGLMELGNRQRAAAARARTTSRRGPTRAEAARNMAEYERAMRARQANLSRGSTPSPRPTPRPVRSGPNVNNTTQAQYQQMLEQVRLGRPATPPRPTPRQTVQNLPNYRPPASLTTEELVRLRANPNRPNMVNQVQTLNQGNALKRQRIQQQIAQLQAQLRQLGG